ncbi:CBL-interacting serine/threonine-protein kinase 7 [Hibiscus syriacus]|uniref:CBL-interacting serine/threonine-protein kinase 7 n=1 Tax=Hibiscus syriacus TaxID=106335 RepID=A0A6A3A2L1_HIBSY|nr:CBL-interacting serine/threonine-protein kinase 7 [Hibiscus syriacus]
MPSGPPPPLPPPPSTPSQHDPPPPQLPSPPPIRITRTKTPTGGILLGKYQLGRLLGHGSFAKVQEATLLDDSSNVVAIKIIDKRKTVDAAMEQRIISEVSAMRRLQHHPNILKIHEVMATKTKIYLVMEFASGGELFSKVLRRGRLTETSARRYFTQLVSALHFCHRNGVAHRDLKPQNLLLDQNGNLKVSDFGLSALPEQLNNALLHTACGTPAYTAPEVVRMKGYDGSKADAWSCGVILFVLLAGKLPFDDSNLVEMYKRFIVGNSSFHLGYQSQRKPSYGSFWIQSFHENELGEVDGNTMAQEISNCVQIIDQGTGQFVAGQEVET